VLCQYDSGRSDEARKAASSIEMGNSGLKVGEITMVVAIAAPHRREIFEAWRYAIACFKQVVPIGKRKLQSKPLVLVEKGESNMTQLLKGVVK
jgi:molybdopterin synthase catalytic subunit